MLRSMENLKGYAIGATDGAVGHLKDLHFDDEAWIVRYFVVDPTGWLSNRKVLISFFAVSKSSDSERVLTISSTREKVTSTSDIDTDTPISREHKMEYVGYFGYRLYWSDDGFWGKGFYRDTAIRSMGFLCAGERDGDLKGEEHVETQSPALPARSKALTPNQGPALPHNHPDKSPPRWKYGTGSHHAEEGMRDGGDLHAAAREFGAQRVRSIAPYLPYMRQDKRFHPHEAVSAPLFAGILEECSDWLVTADPYLHRNPELSMLYRVPTRAAATAPLVADWIRDNVPDAIVIGPGSESELRHRGISSDSDCRHRSAWPSRRLQPTLTGNCSQPALRAR